MTPPVNATQLQTDSSAVPKQPSNSGTGTGGRRDDHPCHHHRPGQHGDPCRAGDCGFCGTSLRTIGSGECRSCLRLLCTACDSGYQSDLGPICRPCTPPGTQPSEAGCTAADDGELHRLCVFEFALVCGHLVTAAVTGWYPVVVACCDRLGGTITRGDYVPFASEIDYVQILSERYERRPAGTRRNPIRLIGRRSRTDEPYEPSAPGFYGSAGRYPASVGSTWNFDGSAVPSDIS